MGDNNIIKKVNKKVTENFESVRNVTIALMVFSIIGIAWELIWMVIGFKWTNIMYLVEQVAYAVEGFLFILLILNFKPERLAFFRNLVWYSTVLECLFLIDIIYDIFKLSFAPMGYLYHAMIILTLIWLWAAYVKMKEIDPDYSAELVKAAKEVNAGKDVGWLDGEEAEYMEDDTT